MRRNSPAELKQTFVFCVNLINCSGVDVLHPGDAKDFFKEVAEIFRSVRTFMFVFFNGNIDQNDQNENQRPQLVVFVFFEQIFKIVFEEGVNDWLAVREKLLKQEFTFLGEFNCEFGLNFSVRHFQAPSQTQQETVYRHLD